MIGAPCFSVSPQSSGKCLAVKSTSQFWLLSYWREWLVFRVCVSRVWQLVPFRKKLMWSWVLGFDMTQSRGCWEIGGCRILGNDWEVCAEISILQSWEVTLVSLHHHVTHVGSIDIPESTRSGQHWYTRINSQWTALIYESHSQWTALIYQNQLTVPSEVGTVHSLSIQPNTPPVGVAK